MATVDVDRLNELVSSGYLSCNRHPTADLLIWNYTPKTQFERHWTPETMMCRGLITDLEGSVKFRPFGKFFNVGEEGTPLLEPPFEITEKMDGSLGILYSEPCARPYELQRWHIATRGSFTSEQAIEATRILHEHAGPPWPIDPTATYLFEIIYPANRIVVDYGDIRALVQLAVIDTETGTDLPISHFPTPFSVVPRYPFHDWTGVQAALDIGEHNREGVVIRSFVDGRRAKAKLSEYVRLHKLLTGVSKRTIWDLLRKGDSLESLLDRVPDEFYVWVSGVVREMTDEYIRIEHYAYDRAEEARKLPNRREQAAQIKDSMCPHVIFKMLDGKPYRDDIWKLIYPAAERPFTRDRSEATA